MLSIEFHSNWVDSPQKNAEGLGDAAIPHFVERHCKPSWKRSPYGATLRTATGSACSPPAHGKRHMVIASPEQIDQWFQSQGFSKPNRELADLRERVALL
jgi:hypothetical protein